VRNSTTIIVPSIQRQNVSNFTIICALFLKKVNAISIYALRAVWSKYHIFRLKKKKKKKKSTGWFPDVPKVVRIFPQQFDRYVSL